MTKLAVIHISDIHIHNKSDQCLRHVSKIASACFSLARDADACLLTITGDVAFSGSVAEYEAARDLLIRPLVDAIKLETARPVYISITPGNHDCMLKPHNEVRETLIQAIIENPSKAEDKDMVAACTQVQDNFFNFVDDLLTPKPEMHSKLFWQQEFQIGGKYVRVSSLNAAWMTRLPESQGQLVYPINLFESQLATPAYLHLALVHHPFNWYSQSAYHQLRKRIRHSCTAILSGHEHVSNAGKIDEQLSGASLFFEAPALQPHERNTTAGFSIHLFDLDQKDVTSQSFSISPTNTLKIGSSISHSWNDDSLIHGALNVSNNFANLLSDAGGNFTHTAKERLTLDDVFVWPDVRYLGDDELGKQRTHSAQEIIGQLKTGKKIIIYGDEKAGKTTLIFWYFRELIAHGFVPVYLSASDLNIKSENDSKRRIDKAISAQYSSPDKIMSFAREKLVLLVDDVDRLKSGLHTLPSLFSYAERHFSSICLTAASGFEVTNLVSSDAANALLFFKNFDLMRFGLKLRHKLIKKWCTLSAVPTKSELDKRIDEVETIVNSVIGKQLVPEYPLYLLILLQSAEQHRHGEIQNSGLSFYYQYLITKSLGEVGVKPTELDEHFNYLSIFAWKFKEKGSKELDMIDLTEVNAMFSKRFVTVDLSERLALLTRARVFAKHGDSYSFAYPYIYYFFIGRYLAKNIDRPDIRAWIEESCRKLYLRDRANAIMFLSHHVENSWVIGLICQVLRECFSDKRPVELNEDTAFLNQLVEQSSQLTLMSTDIDKNQSDVREFKDTLVDSINPEEESNQYDLLSITAKWNLLHKTAEILGLILKNYYGSLERPQKQEMIREVFDGPLRALRLWLDEIAADIPRFVQELQLAELTQDSNLTHEAAERRVNRRVFNILGWVATGVIASSGSFVASNKLREDIAVVVDGQPDNNAYRLIQAASVLLKPGSLPLAQIRKLAEDLERNPYAFGVLQSLGFSHMYMFHMDEPQKQSLSSMLKISLGAVKSTDIKKSARMLN